MLDTLIHHGHGSLPLALFSSSAFPMRFALSSFLSSLLLLAAVFLMQARAAAPLQLAEADALALSVEQMLEDEVWLTELEPEEDGEPPRRWVHTGPRLLEPWSSTEERSEMFWAPEPPSLCALAPWAPSPRMANAWVDAWPRLLLRPPIATRASA